MQLVLHTYGLSLKIKTGMFVVADKENRREISPEHITSIAVISPCLISSGAIELAATSNIPIYFFDERGETYASMRSPYFESLATLRRLQVYFSDHMEGASWVIEQFVAKTNLQVKYLTQIANQRKQYKKILEAVIEKMADSRDAHAWYGETPSREWAARVMGWEGHMARTYWSGIGRLLDGFWSFARRSRRPAVDPFNATINYLYAFLYTLVEQALFGAGLDPHLGILHVDDYDQPTLAYDLIEPFRPMVDELVVKMIVTGKAPMDGYEEMNEGIWLNKAGKHFWIPAFNEHMNQPIRWEGRQMKRQSHIFRRADELAQRIRKTVKRPE